MIGLPCVRTVILSSHPHGVKFWVWVEMVLLSIGGGGLGV